MAASRKNKLKPKPKPSKRTTRKTGLFAPPFSLRAKLIIVVLAMIPAAYSLRLVLAAPQPSFKVDCAATRMAPDDPIVFPGQPGKSHMHSFFGARTVDGNSTLASLLAAPESACGANFGIDRSAYWVPLLYKNGQPVFATDGSIRLTAYYQRGGDSTGTPISQPYPQGLRIIAGDMYATTPTAYVWFKCANTVNFGSQNSLGQSVPSCKSDETLVSEIHFPDCWNGTSLDSPNHKSHMAYSSNGNCPAGFPVKVPKVRFEVKYTGVNGPASQFSFSSGSPYSFHGDIFSAWEPRSFAALVNVCLNFVSGEIDCNPRLRTDISTASVTQAQIDSQTRLASQQPAPTPTPVPKPTPPATPNPSPSTGGSSAAKPPVSSGTSGSSMGGGTASAGGAVTQQGSSSGENASMHEHGQEAATGEAGGAGMPTPVPDAPQGIARFAQVVTEPKILVAITSIAIGLGIVLLYVFRSRIAWWFANIRARIRL